MHLACSYHDGGITLARQLNTGVTTCVAIAFSLQGSVMHCTAISASAMLYASLTWSGLDQRHPNRSMVSKMTPSGNKENAYMVGLCVGQTQLDPGIIVTADLMSSKLELTCEAPFWHSASSNTNRLL